MSIKHLEWKKTYSKPVLETIDATKLFQLLCDAEVAINLRLKGLQKHSSEESERRALQDALLKVRNLARNGARLAGLKQV
jgi:hypothetical protein